MQSRWRVSGFFLFAFVFTWGLQLPGVLAQRGVLPGVPSSYFLPAALGIFGPALAALVLTVREGGRPALAELLTRSLRWRASLRWYVFALLPALLLSGFLALLSMAGWRGPLAYVPALSGVIVGVIASIAEEIGWRGFALPRLQRRWGSFTASAVIGLLWYLWHLPMFLGQGVPLNLWPVMVLYFCGASLLLTAIYNGGRGGLVLPVIGHFAAHLNNSHRALPLEQLPLVAHAIIYAALGLWLMRRQAQRGTSSGRPSATAGDSDTCGRARSSGNIGGDAAYDS